MFDASRTSPLIDVAGILIGFLVISGEVREASELY